MKAGMAMGQWQEHGVGSHRASATRKRREISASDPSPCTVSLSPKEGLSTSVTLPWKYPNRHSLRLIP